MKLIIRLFSVLAIFGASILGGRAQTAVRVFPNPVNDYFILGDEANVVEQIVVINILGKPLKTFRAADGPRFNINDIPEGIYLVRFIGASNNVLKTVRISKMRPKA